MPILEKFYIASIGEEAMKYRFESLVGNLVVDDQGKISTLGSLREKATKKPRELPLLPLLPLEKAAPVLAALKDKKYFAEFYRKNMQLTKKSLKEAVSDDELIVQAIANIGELDKVANLLSKRVREWYSLYFPELAARVSDHARYLALLTTKSREKIMAELQLSETMGADLPPEQVQEVQLLAREVLQLYQLREQHEAYLQEVMKKHCPNLLELAGATIGAKLLELRGGLKRLALLPGSTIQLLGAEKALFRHLRSGAAPPKYGVLFAHPLVQKARKENRGKAARSLADKLSLCARLDYFKGELKASQYKKELEGRFITLRSNLKR